MRGRRSRLSPRAGPGAGQRRSEIVSARWAPPESTVASSPGAGSSCYSPVACRLQTPLREWRRRAGRRRLTTVKGSAYKVLARIGVVTSLIVGVLGAGAASAAQDAADLVLRHGTIYPVSAPGSLAGSVAVRGGRIVYVGDDAGAAALVGPRTEVVELRGRALIPGLIDAHSHLEGLGLALESVDLVGAD